MSSPFGNYFVDRDQPPLSSGEEAVVRQFHDLYYRRWIAKADTINLSCSDITSTNVRLICGFIRSYWSALGLMS
jgi:hypothetical protein